MATNLPRVVAAVLKMLPHPGLDRLPWNDVCGAPRIAVAVLRRQPEVIHVFECGCDGRPLAATHDENGIALILAQRLEVLEHLGQSIVQSYKKGHRRIQTAAALRTHLAASNCENTKGK